jgi:hypothetical protein
MALGVTAGGLTPLKSLTFFPGLVEDRPALVVTEDGFVQGVASVGVQSRSTTVVVGFKISNKYPVRLFDEEGE